MHVQFLFDSFIRPVVSARKQKSFRGLGVRFSQVDLNGRCDYLKRVGQCSHCFIVSGIRLDIRIFSVLLQPLDRLKTLSQEDAVRQTNVIQRTATVIRHHGPLDLWRGIVPTLLRVVPGVAVYFGCLEVGRTFVPRGANKNATNFLLGAVSRSVAVALLMPATVIKTRFESSFYRDASVLSAAMNVLNQNGVRGLFKGIVPTLMRDAPFSGLYLLFYRQYLRLFNKEGRVHLPATRFSSGVLAGLMACAVTQPFDITKTHVQLYPQRYRSMLCVIGHLYSRGGIIAFFNGFWLRAVRRTFMSAMNWTIFDELFGSRVHDD